MVCSNLSALWQTAFGGAWKRPHRQTISGLLLDQSYQSNRITFMDFIKSNFAICMSVDGFYDVNSKTLLNFMAGGPLPFVFKMFRIEGKKQSAANMYKELLNVINHTSVLIDCPRKVLRLLTDSPPVMQVARKLLCGSKSGRSSHVFSRMYACVTP